MERIAETAERVGRAWQEAFMYPHHPQTEKLLEVTRAAMAGDASSPIGELHSIRASAMVDLGDGAHVEYRLRHSMQGGAMADLGVYPVGLCRYLTGEEPVEGSVRATARRARMPGGEAHAVDGGIFVTFEMPSGVICNCSASLDAWGGHGVELIGTKASLATGFPFWPDPRKATMELRHKNRTVGKIRVWMGGDRIERQFRHFGRACAGEVGVRPSVAWSVGQARMIEMIWESLGWERLPKSAEV